MTTSRLQLASATNTTVKAIVFGAISAVVLGLGIAHAEGQREMRAAVVKLDTVVITAKREQLPTVYVTGRRNVAGQTVQIASAQ